MKVFSCSIIFVCLLLVCNIDALARIRDWARVAQIKTLIDADTKARRSIGYVPNSYDFYDKSLAIRTPPPLQVNPRMYGTTQFDIVDGAGILLKGMPDGQPKGKAVPMRVTMTLKVENVCGVFIGSRSDAGDDIMDHITIAWRGKGSSKARLIADTFTGNTSFYPNLADRNDRRAIFFESVPAESLSLKIFPRDGKRVSIRIAVIHSCFYSDTRYIVKCGDMVANNTKFSTASYGKPINIRCPTDCIQERPCWGYEVYSYDSPICWAATQIFGREGNGQYTMYKVQRALMFRDMINPALNNKIYCRRYDKPYEAYTFSRKSFDDTIAEYIKRFGA